MKERSRQAQMQMIACILKKKKTNKASESSNVSGHKRASERATGKFSTGRVTKRNLEKSTGRTLTRNDAPRRHNKASNMKQSSSAKSGYSQERQARNHKLNCSIKGKTRNGSEIIHTADDLKRKRQRRKKKGSQDVPQDEVACIRRRIRYLLIKIKQEQNFIDAYSGEGWKGQSREKLRPEKELQRAGNQILKCKLSIREAVHQLDLLGREGSIADSVIDSEGRIHHEHIFCAICKLQDALPDNDIILCDGACNRGFHQKCLNPPLATENIPPGDQGWLCNVCECKLEGLEAINAYLGTQFTVTNKWEEIFSEAAKIANGESTSGGAGEEWPSDDSEDDDYDPEKQEIRNETGYENDTDHSVDSDDTESLGESNISDVSLTDDIYGFESQSQKRYWDSDYDIAAHFNSDENEESCVPVSGKRQRRDVDYKKLHDEMFGKEDSNGDEISEDEDWGPSGRARREKQPDLSISKVSASEEKEKTGTASLEQAKESCQKSIKTKRHIVRLPANAVEELRKVFAENELPSRSFKEKLSQQLGLTFGKVHMWFKNARYMALKSRKEMCGNEKSTATEQAGEDQIESRKQNYGEKKSESSHSLSLLSVNRNSRISKGKYRRRNKKPVLLVPFRNEKKRTICRLPANAVERLRQAFSENQLPSTSYKLSLAKQLNLPFRQVHMWFKNTRYMALKRKKLEQNGSACKSSENGTLHTEKADNTNSSYLQMLEMLVSNERKVESLKRTIESVCLVEDYTCNNNRFREGSAGVLNSNNVMYVPVAELREKFTSCS